MRKTSAWALATLLALSAVSVRVLTQENSKDVAVSYSRGKVCSIVAVGKDDLKLIEQGKPPRTGPLWRDTFPIPDTWTPNNCSGSVGAIAGAGAWSIGCFNGGTLTIGKFNDGTPIPPCW